MGSAILSTLVLINGIVLLFCLLNIIYPFSKHIPTRGRATLYTLLSLMIATVITPYIEPEKPPIKDTTIKAAQVKVPLPIIKNTNSKEKAKKRFIADKYTKKSNPSAWKKWGPKWIAKINHLRQQAATIVEQSPKCDHVIMSELSGNRSKPKKHISIFIDCNNDERFYLTEKEITANTQATSEQQKVNQYSHTTLITPCRTAVKAQLRYPSSYDERLFGDAVVNKSPHGHRLTVTIDFKAKNGLGTLIPQRAICYVDGTGLKSVEINDR